MADDEHDFGIEKFERLAKDHGEIVALLSDTRFDERAALGETDLLKFYLKWKANDAAMPDDMKAVSQMHMEQLHAARAAIQDYKIRHGLKLDTPPAQLEDPHAPNTNAANDPVYGAQIYTLDL